MSTVRAFAARVVRPDRAADTVTALAEPPAESDAAYPEVVVEEAAYDVADPALYVYRQRSAARDHTGLVCEVAIEAFLDGGVRGHEAVQPQRVDALVRHAPALTRRPGLVTLLHHAGPAYTREVEAAVATAPLLDFTGPAGVPQSVWRIDAGSSTLADEVAGADLYLADGHHRVAAAITDWRLRGEPAGTGLLCIVHPMDGLRLSAFHRRLVGPLDRPCLLELVSEEFLVSPVGHRPEPRAGSFGLYAGGEWFEVHSPLHHDRCLDVTVLQNRIIDPLRRAELAGGVEILSARTTVAELTARCDQDGGALFTLAPPPLAVLTGLADAGRVMPPKTTYFDPKPCSGIFLRP